jgi:hypothetical protein|tara:strand:- start:141 stop:743 length:603 start_codon:yes stop_codon:yes gene_type:complete
MDLPDIQPSIKTGKEQFFIGKPDLNIPLLDFWQWNQSNLIENRTRGILAEFIVMKAFEVESKARVEWDDFDIITDQDIKIEVKSSAFIQTWEQTKFSSIDFSIGPSKRYLETPGRPADRLRPSDIYVFALLAHKEQKTIDPMNLNQWCFFVMSSRKIDAERGPQQRITLNSLKSLSPIECNYQNLKTTVEKIIKNENYSN